MPVAASDLPLLSRLLDEALALPADRRDAWLDALPATARHLRAPLRDMLAERDQTGTSGFLKSLPPLPETLPPDAATAHPDDVVGAYRLIHEIGRGGMGEVWLADRIDGVFRRRVALKLPRLAWGRGLAQRMAREREIGALLEHPHIARLYDAGVDERGRPFLALEYVNGVQIDTWCTERGLAIRERLALIVQVARAVSYAHGRLVVHRDLKPSNVLVTPDGQTHLLDFGIAKLLDDQAAGAGALTQEHDRVMTPHYASPEQIRGEMVTVQSDIYSLGVMTYQLLTGATPFEQRRDAFGGVDDRDAEPPLASTRVARKAEARALRGEVDAILAKALRFDPAQRYPSADALASDIERHLSGERVLAQPDSTWYRIRKTVRRHRTGVLATGAVLAAIVGGSAAAVIQARQAARSAERERVVKEFVTDLFRVNSHSDSAGSELRKLPAEQLLEHGASLIAQRFPGQPELQAELYGVVGGVFEDMGADALAIDYSTRQADLLSSLKADDDVQARVVLRLARSLFAEDRDAAAVLSARRAAALAHGHPSLEAEALLQLARAQRNMGSKEESRASVESARSLLASVPDTPSVGRAWLTWMEGVRLRDSSAVDLWLPLYQKAIAEADKIEGGDSKTAREMRIRLAHTMVNNDREKDALAMLTPTLKAMDNASGAEAVRAALVRADLWSLMSRSYAVPLDQAISVIEQSEQSMAAQMRIVPEVLLARVAFAKVMALNRRGQLAEAGQLLNRHAATLRGTWESPGDLSDLALEEASVAMRRGDHERADVLYKEWLRLLTAAGWGAAPTTVMAYVDLSFNRTAQGNEAAAAGILDSAPQVPRLAGEPEPTGYTFHAIEWERARLALSRGDVQGALARIAPFGDRDDAESDVSFVSVIAPARRDPLRCEPTREGIRSDAACHPIPSGRDRVRRGSRPRTFSRRRRSLCPGVARPRDGPENVAQRPPRFHAGARRGRVLAGADARTRPAPRGALTTATLNER